MTALLFLFIFLTFDAHASVPCQEDYDSYMRASKILLEKDAGMRAYVRAKASFDSFSKEVQGLSSKNRQSLRKRILAQKESYLRLRTGVDAAVIRAQWRSVAVLACLDQTPHAGHSGWAGKIQERGDQLSKAVADTEEAYERALEAYREKTEEDLSITALPAIRVNSSKRGPKDMPPPTDAPKKGTPARPE